MMDIVGRLVAIFWIFIFWRAYKHGGIPIRIRGYKQPAFIYTKWRMLILILATMIFTIIPVIIWGSGLFEFFPIRIHPFIFLWFWSSIVILPVLYVLLAIAQVWAERNSTSKQKNK